MDTVLLKKIMRSRGVSQEKLADAIGVDRSTLNRKMHGVRKGFFVVEVDKVGRYLGLTGQELMSVFFDGYGG